MILTKNGNLMKFASGAAVNAIIPPIDPYNPLDLPPFTIRCKFAPGYTPTTKTSSASWDSTTLVDAAENIWDITRNSTDWAFTMFSQSNLLEVLGANTTGITNMSGTFKDCISLERVALFDTSSVTTMGGGEAYGMFKHCRSLKTVPLFDTRNVTIMRSMFASSFDPSEYMQLEEIPLFDTSSCTDIRSMFYFCKNVKSGALALYQQASTQAVPPTEFRYCFYECGSDTTTGAAERAQIPSSWGGTAS